MTTPQQQIIDKCNQVIARVQQLYGMDLSAVRISFDMRGRSAGQAGGRGYSQPASSYYVKFNRDMLHREAFEHLLNNTVPHEFAHVVCFMNPSLGKNHDAGWARVCQNLGGSGARTHREEVVYGNGRTYEYTTDRGHKVRLSERRHSYVRSGGVLRYKGSLGVVNSACAFSIVGVQGRTLAAPVEVKTPDVQAAKAVPVQQILQPVMPKPPAFNRGESKASIARAVMLSGHSRGMSYDQIIAAIMAATGHDRQLSRAYYKGNFAKVGVPAPQ